MKNLVLGLFFLFFGMKCFGQGTATTVSKKNIGRFMVIAVETRFNNVTKYWVGVSETQNESQALQFAKSCLCRTPTQAINGGWVGGTSRTDVMNIYNGINSGNISSKKKIISCF